MSRTQHGSLAVRSDLVHRAESHYGMKRSADDATLTAGTPGPSSEERIEAEVQQILATVVYAQRPAGVKQVVKVKCSSPAVRERVLARLTPEQLAGIKLC